jgi:hypothetical protein
MIITMANGQSQRGKLDAPPIYLSMERAGGVPARLIGVETRFSYYVHQGFACLLSSIRYPTESPEAVPATIPARWFRSRFRARHRAMPVKSWPVRHDRESSSMTALGMNLMSAGLSSVRSIGELPFIAGR